MRKLTTASLRRAAAELAAADPALAATYARWGPPPLWAREPTFATLVHLILEQQVSLASAQAAFDRLATALGEVTPEGVLTLDDAGMKAIGFSRQKTGYARDLAIALEDGLDLDSLARQADDEVRARLMAHRGIGRTRDGRSRCPRTSRAALLRRARVDRRALASVPRGRGTDALARLPPAAQPPGWGLRTSTRRR